MRSPPLIALRAFEAVGRTGSIRAAGDELGVSHTVVSRHVRNLEEHVGINLIVQQGRGIVLTPPGRRYHARISEAFSSILQATAELSPAYRKSLDVWCMPGTAYRLLDSLIDELSVGLADIDVSFRPTLERPDLQHGEADAEIVYLDRTDPDESLQLEELARPRVFPVASPKFLQDWSPIRTLADLVAAPLLHEQSTRYWTTWLTAAGMGDVPGLPGPKLWHANFTLRAAADGRGVALANDFLLTPFHGDVVEVLETNVSIGAYYLIVAAQRRHDPTVRKLSDWARRAFRG